MTTADVERVLARALGARPKVQSMTSAPSPFASLFPADVLRMRLDSGAELSLFVKHLGDEQADHPEKQRRDREILVYERLLGAVGLPVARYFGTMYDGLANRRDVYLEYIPDWDLRYQPLEYWHTAARRLGDLHAHFAARADELSRCDFLLRIDAAFVQAWAERAIPVVEEYDADAGAAFRRVARAYGCAATLLAAQPPTLVHNDLAPKNVVVNRAPTPARVAFVDWEMAGIGCGLLDLVDLAYGLDAASVGRLHDSYRAAVADTALLPSGRGELARVVAAAELHRTVHRLAHSRSWSLPAERVRAWVGDAVRLLREVEQ